MLTKEDLHAIVELLQPINKRLETIETNMVTKRDLVTNNHVLATLLRVDLATTKREIIEAIKAGFQEIVKRENKQDSRIQDHHERLTELEGVTLTHKN